MLHKSDVPRPFPESDVKSREGEARVCESACGRTSNESAINAVTISPGDEIRKFEFRENRRNRGDKPLGECWLCKIGILVGINGY